MKKATRDQIKHLLIRANAEIEQSIRWIDKDGSKQVPESHKYTCTSVIAKMKSIQDILNE